jgi:uncharacterized protein (DUF2147 family)
MRSILFLSVLSIILNTSAYAGGDEIIGIWNTQEKDAKIEIIHCGEKYCGKIVWLKEPNYSEGSKSGTPGTPLLDRYNPDPLLKNKSLMGLQIMYDFVYDGGNTWTAGKVYDPTNGKAYSANMTLVSPNQLNLRGFIGISLLGRTEIWTR